MIPMEELEGRMSDEAHKVRARLPACLLHECMWEFKT
jgi:hypothetical protein